MMIRKIVENINDLKFKSHEIFTNNYFIIKNDDIYLTEDFLKILYENDINKKKILWSNHHIRIKNYYILTICFKKLNTESKYNWLLAGSCGSSGFNGMQQSSKYLLGKTIKRQCIKYVIDIYLNSSLCRFEKIMNLKEKINKTLSYI